MKTTLTNTWVKCKLSIELNVNFHLLFWSMCVLVHILYVVNIFFIIGVYCYEKMIHNLRKFYLLYILNHKLCFWKSNLKKKIRIKKKTIKEYFFTIRFKPNNINILIICKIQIHLKLLINNKFIVKCE